MNIYDIWFSRVEISNEIKLRLLESFETLEIWNLTKEDFLDLGLKDITIKKILDNKYKENLEKYEKFLEKNNIYMFSYKDEEYPIKLKNIFGLPAYIFVRGNKEILDGENIAIIGARNCTDYGKNIASRTAKELGDRNINVVSGLAVGIDKYAHLGSLESLYGKTIAVLGNGLAMQDIYPTENIRLAKEILKKGGALVSEYIIGTKATKYNFPARNRIVSGLSDKILVVEGTKKSGTLITVGYALEQGKEVFSVPGRLNEKNSEGTNMLISQGANIFIDVQDLLLR